MDNYWDSSICLGLPFPKKGWRYVDDPPQHQLLQMDGFLSRFPFSMSDANTRKRVYYILGTNRRSR